MKNSIISLGIVLLFINLFGFPEEGIAQYERPGSASGQFLKLSVSPRAAAMGNAYIAVPRGAEATYYNPAVMARIDGTHLSLAHTDWFADLNHDFFSMTKSFNRIGAFGLSVTNFSTDLMKVRTPLQPEGTGETFFANSFRAGISYARILTNHVSFGATLNYINIRLAQDFSEHAFASDISAFYITDFRGFQFGMKIANFGSSITFVNEQYPLPLYFNFGMAIHAVERGASTIMVSASVQKPNDSQTMIRGGAEWDFSNRYFLRAGYQFNHDFGTYSLGAGLHLPIGNQDIYIDYSYNMYKQLGGIQRFGVDFAF